MGRVLDARVPTGRVVADDGLPGHLLRRAVRVIRVRVAAAGRLLVVVGRTAAVASDGAVGAVRAAGGAIRRGGVGGSAVDAGAAVVRGRGAHGTEDLALGGVYLFGTGQRRVRLRGRRGVRVGAAQAAARHRGRGLASRRAGERGAPAAVARGRVLPHLVSGIAAHDAAADGRVARVRIGVVRVVLDLLAALLLGREPRLALLPEEQADDGQDGDGDDGDDDADGYLPTLGEAAASTAAGVDGRGRPRGLG